MKTLIKRKPKIHCRDCQGLFRPSLEAKAVCPECKVYNQAFEDGKNASKIEIEAAIDMLEKNNAAYLPLFDNSKLVNLVSMQILKAKSIERRLNNRDIDKCD